MHAIGALLVALSAPQLQAEGSASQADAGAPAGAQVRGNFEELLAEFDEAEVIWRQAVAEAKGAEKARLLTEPPERQFWSLFEDLSKKGEGRATLWLFERIDYSALGALERSERRVELLQDLASRHAGAPWIGKLGPLLFEWRGLGREPRAGKALRALVDGSSNEIGACEVLYYWGSMIRFEGEERRAGPLIAEFVERCPDHALATMARGKLFALENLQVGKPIPELAGKDVDGKELRLADHRGKVVVLDFWGFW